MHALGTYDCSSGLGSGSNSICVAGCVSGSIWAYVYCEYIVILCVCVCISESVLIYLS